MPDGDARPAGAPATGTLHDLDLLSPASARPGAFKGMAWRLIHVAGLPVGRANLPVDASGSVLEPSLADVVGATGMSRAIAGALARRIVDGLARGGGTGLHAAMHATLREDSVERQLPTLTLAICTRDRPAQLERALRALSPLLSSGVKALVVESAPSDPRGSAVLQAAYPGVRFFIEPVAGLDVARNRALNLAETDLIAFTDDDTVVSPSHARSIREVFEGAPEVAVTCGLVEPLDPGTEGALVVESYGGLGKGYRRCWTFAPAPPPVSLIPSLGITSRIGSGASMAVRREVALAIGGFDTALDAGTPVGAGGDLEFLFRALKAGYAACYEPAAVLRHEHRATREAALSQVEQWGAGMGAYLERTGVAYPEERWPARLLLAWLLTAHYGRRGVASIVSPAFPRDMLWRDVRGLLRGARRYRESARHAPAPVAPRAPAVSEVITTNADLDLRQPITSLRVQAAARVHITVHLDGTTLGTLTLQSVRDHVGGARIADAVADAFGERLIGIPRSTAGPALLTAVRSGA